MKTKILETLPFFYKFSSNDMEKAASFAIQRSYSRNSFIFMEGDIGDEFYIVLSGFVEINRFENGRKFVLCTLGTGDFFGEMALFEEGEVRSANAEAVMNAEVVTKTSLLAIKRQDLLGFLEAYPSITLHLLTTLIKRLRKTNELIHDINFLDVRSRIYKQLLRLVAEHGVGQDETMIINLRLTHQQIADMVGCTREMVTKVLIELQAEQIIDVIKKKIIVKNTLLLSDKVVEKQSYKFSSSFYR